MLVDGKVRYSPDEAFEGLDTFTYVLEDAKGEQVVGVVEVNVLAEPPPWRSGLRCSNHLSMNCQSSSSSL